ncbi:MAG: hypothetical protein ACOWWO_05235 [Peptococcaceae bacterium]
MPLLFKRTADLDPGRKRIREEFTDQLVKGIEKQGNLPLINVVPAEIADEGEVNIVYSGAIQHALTYGMTRLDSEGSFHDDSLKILLYKR